LKDFEKEKANSQNFHKVRIKYLLGPLFSIIIPTYNSEKTIENCLKSILNQQYKSYEILIIDGVSKDQTLNIVRSFANESVKIFSAPDKGIYDAMNKGIAIANGEWLYFLGSDDKLHDDRVLQKISLIAQNQEAKLIYGNVLMDDTNLLYCGKVNDVEILYKNICQQAIYYKNQIFKNHQFNLKFKVFADHDLNLKLFQYDYKQIFYTDTLIANYSNSGFSSKMTDDFSKELHNIRKDFLKTKNWLFQLRYKLYNFQLTLEPSPLRGLIFRLFRILSL